MYFIYICFMKNEFLENWHSQLRKGMLPIFVLHILNKKTFYGYELIQEIKSVFDIDVAEGTLYPLLVRLTKDEQLIHNWVEQPSGIPRKYYAISLLGKENLNKMKNHLPLIISKLK